MTELAGGGVDADQSKRGAAWLLAAVFLASICGLGVELVAGALASYLLGNSVAQFSIIIGLFLTSMGLGSFASRFLESKLLANFVLLEIAIGLVGGLSALAGFAAFAYTESYAVVLYGGVIAVGALVGLEIPLVIRILERVSALRITVANVLGMDYLGAFVASLAFPFLLLPQFGIVQAGILAGIVNLGVAGVLWRVFNAHLEFGRRGLGVLLLLSALLLGGAFFASGGLVAHFENRSYQDEVIYSRTTKYQRVVVTKWREDVRLYLNGHLQFSSVDEYRYHEALAHPAMSAVAQPTRVLILGGGDGMLVREILKYKTVERVVLVDLDPTVTDLFRDHSMLSQLNDRSLHDARVSIENRDALGYLRETAERFDVILCDLPDPSEPALGKLYSETFYGLAARRLAEDGALATQATSPFRSRDAYWCIANTLAATQLPANFGGGPDTEGSESKRSRATTLGDLAPNHPNPAGATPTDSTSTGFQIAPYQTVVPTFGTWGFVLASARPIQPQSISLRVNTRFLTDESMAAMFVLPKDLKLQPTKINRLNDPVIDSLYRSSYEKYLR